MVSITEDPLIVKGEASSPFDEEGVATRRRAVVEVESCAGIFSAAIQRASLACKPTGNAGGTHNLLLQYSGQDFPQLLKQMGRGLMVTEMCWVPASTW